MGERRTSKTALLAGLRHVIAVVDHRRDPLAFHRKRGVRIGARVELFGTTPHTFGGEPYLVTIGDDVTVSNDVEFITHDGGFRVVRHVEAGAFRYAPITVEQGAFIGARAILMPGVTIGEHAVVGAGAVVTRDVPPSTVVAGVPARVIRTVAEYVAERRESWVDTSALNPVEKEALLRRRFGR